MITCLEAHGTCNWAYNLRITGMTHVRPLMETVTRRKVIRPVVSCYQVFCALLPS